MSSHTKFTSSARAGQERRGNSTFKSQVPTVDTHSNTQMHAPMYTHLYTHTHKQHTSHTPHTWSSWNGLNFSSFRLGLLKGDSVDCDAFVVQLINCGVSRKFVHAQLG